MQPEKLAEVRSWLKKAASDLRGADLTKPIYGDKEVGSTPEVPRQH